MARTGAVVALTGSALFFAGIVLPFVTAAVDRPRDRRSPAAAPRPRTLDVVIPAYLEAGVVGDGVRRLADQLTSWPGDATITVVASDDATAAAAASAGARVVRTAPEGKPAAVNTGVAGATADAIVLTDANCEILPAEWPALLADEFDGAELVSAMKSETGGRESAFWKYESAVKSSQGTDRPTMSVAGEFLAFRRIDFRPIPPGALTDDLFLARDFVERGLRVRNAEGIRTSEAAATGSDQWERRVRIAAGVYLDALPGWRGLLREPAGRQFLAHKGYRMTVGALGFWLGAIGAAIVLLPWSAVAVAALVGSAILVYTRGARSGVVGALSSVVALQAVPVLGAIRALRRRRSAAVGWKKVER